MQRTKGMKSDIEQAMPELMPEPEKQARVDVSIDENRLARLAELGISKEQFIEWGQGSQGFFQWIRDVRPCIPNADGQYKPVRLAKFQQKHIRRSLSTTAYRGYFRYETLIFSYPRRHSKTSICALICLWRFVTREGENIACLSNSKSQSANASFGLVKKISLNTPFLRRFIGIKHIQSEKILDLDANNILQAVPSNETALYGQKVTCGWVTELHAAANDNAMQVLGSSMGDSNNTFLIIDSTIDAVGGPLHRYQQLVEKKEDKSICLNMLQYEDLQDAIDNRPHWIKKSWLEARHKQMLPEMFATQHLNQRAESSSSLFATKLVKAASDNNLSEHVTKAELEDIADGRSYLVGAGLDRAYSFSKHGDATIFTTVAKIASHDPNDEPHFYVLDQKNIFASLGKIIKKEIQSADNEYKLNGLTIESYNSQDIHSWAQSKDYPSEIVVASAQAQTTAFLELHRLFIEKRIHFSPELKDLEQELCTFQYTVDKGAPKFGTKHLKDDRVYSLLWAVHSVRQQELSSYTLDEIICHSNSQHAPYCFLRNEDTEGILLPCAEKCKSAIKVRQMYTSYKAINLDTELNLTEFFKNVVNCDGIIAIL